VGIPFDSPAAMKMACAGRVPAINLAGVIDFSFWSSATKNRRISSFGFPSGTVSAGRTTMYVPLV